MSAGQPQTSVKITVSTTSQNSDARKLHNQGVLSEVQGRFVEAETAFRQALRAWEILPDATSEEIAATLNGLGNLLRVEGHFLEAERLLRRAITLEEEAGAPARLDLAFTLNSLGALYCNVREPVRAMPLLERSLEIREQILGSNHPLISASLDNLAWPRHSSSNVDLTRPKLSIGGHSAFWKSRVIHPYWR